MSSFDRRARVVLIGAMLSLFWPACTSPAQRGPGSSMRNRQGAVDDTARHALLEREAPALVRATGCDAVSSCRAATVRWRACGGPRDYVIYCAATTDTAALLRKLEELERAEMEHNDRTGAMGTVRDETTPRDRGPGRAM